MRLPDYSLDGGDSDSETGNAIRIPCNPTGEILFILDVEPRIHCTDLQSAFSE